MAGWRAVPVGRLMWLRGRVSDLWLDGPVITAVTLAFEHFLSAQGRLRQGRGSYTLTLP